LCGTRTADSAGPFLSGELEQAHAEEARRRGTLRDPAPVLDGLRALAERVGAALG
jgi:hypothetical protein